MPPVLRVLFVKPSARDMQLVAEILHQATDSLPSLYVFDVVNNNVSALDRVSRTAYRLVCVAEAASSALDGRDAASILRQACPGITVILVLEDERVKDCAETSNASAEGGQRQRRNPSSPRKRKRPRSTDSGIFRDARIRQNRDEEPSGEALETPTGVNIEWDAERARVVGRHRHRQGGAMRRDPPMVDFSVVDYVLRNPFSDETFRRLLEVVEADHLQIPLLLKEVHGGKTVKPAADPAVVEGSFRDSDPALTEGVLSPAIEGHEADPTGRDVIDPQASYSASASDYLDHPDTDPPQPEEPWLPLKDREVYDDADRLNASRWLPPEPPLLPPPPPPRPKYDPSTPKPPAQWSQGGYTTSPPYPQPLCQDQFYPPIPAGAMFPPTPKGLPMHVPHWIHGPGWYPMMAAPAQHQPYFYQPHPFHNFGGQSHMGMAQGGVGGNSYTPAAAAAAAAAGAAAQAGTRVAAVTQNGVAFPSSSPAAVTLSAASSGAPSAQPLTVSVGEHSRGKLQASFARTHTGTTLMTQMPSAARTKGATKPLTASAARRAGGTGRKRPLPEARSSAQRASDEVNSATAVLAVTAMGGSAEEVCIGASVDATKPAVMTLEFDSENTMLETKRIDDLPHGQDGTKQLHQGAIETKEMPESLSASQSHEAVPVLGQQALRSALALPDSV